MEARCLPRPWLISPQREGKQTLSQADGLVVLPHALGALEAGSWELGGCNRFTREIATRCNLAENTCDVVLGFFFLGLDEDFVGLAKLNKFTKVHVNSEIGDSSGLLHVVGYDSDGVV